MAELPLARRVARKFQPRNEQAAGFSSVEERDQLLEELARANRRLSGTLEIVLGTIDAGDVGTLFSRVTEQINLTMEATGTLLYLLDDGVERLYAASEGTSMAKMPRQLNLEHIVPAAPPQTNEALRLRVLRPSQDALRQGELSFRELINEQTQEHLQVPVGKLPPWASMLVAPVWFGGYQIATLVVGWDRTRVLSHDDGVLLGAVARYLSTQLAGAISTIRQQKRMELSDANTKLHKLLMDMGEETAARRTQAGLDNGAVSSETRYKVAEACDLLQAALSCKVGVLRASPHQVDQCELAMGAELLSVVSPPESSAPDTPAPESPALEETADTVVQGYLVVPLSFAELGCDLEATGLLPAESSLCVWLAEQGLPSKVAFVSLNTFGEQQGALLALRTQDEDDFDDLELTFLARVGEDIRDAARAGERQSHDRRIAQALQTGMRNELQKVDGLRAQGVYSSATEAAFVGGDFYDLIRLPGRHACVIMGDVSGKGVEAASVSAAVRTALGAYSWEGLRPAHMVELLNEFLLGFSRLETFATLFVGVINVATGELTYCSAGHPPAIVVRSATGDLDLCSVQSGVVGAFSEMHYRDGQTTLAPGDILVLYTDGTTEARAADGAFYGEEGLREAVLAELPAGFEGLLDRLLERVDDFTGRHLDDDVALVAVRFDGIAS